MSHWPRGLKADWGGPLDRGGEGYVRKCESHDSPPLGTPFWCMERSKHHSVLATFEGKNIGWNWRGVGIKAETTKNTSTYRPIENLLEQRNHQKNIDTCRCLNGNRQHKKILNFIQHLRRWLRKILNLIWGNPRQIPLLGACAPEALVKERGFSLPNN